MSSNLAGGSGWSKDLHRESLFGTHCAITKGKDIKLLQNSKSDTQSLFITSRYRKKAGIAEFSEIIKRKDREKKIMNCYVINHLINTFWRSQSTVSKIKVVWKIGFFCFSDALGDYQVRSRLGFLIVQDRLLLINWSSSKLVLWCISILLLM